MSLIELMVGLLLSVLVLGGLFHVAVLSSRNCVSARLRVRALTNLNMAREELSELLGRVEPAFWQRFPARGGPCEGQVVGGAIFIDDSGATGDVRLTVMDVVPSAQAPLLFEVVEDGFPDWMRLTPVDHAATFALPDSITSTSVFLIVSEHDAFPILVREMIGDQIFLCSSEETVWAFPSSVDLASARVVYLGVLCVTECALAEAPGRKKKLVYRRWSLREEGWVPGRRWSSFTQIDALSWSAADAAHPNRLVLKHHLDESGQEGSTPSLGHMEEIYAIVEL